MDNVPISPLIPIRCSGASYDQPHNHINISSSLPTPRHLLQLGNNNDTAGGGLEEEEEEEDAHDYATNKPSKNNIRYRYRECLKNHAASMGGSATDGCGEFMPGGEEGSLEALKCSACNCHRNFHRKESEDDGGGGVRYYHLLNDQNIMSCSKKLNMQQQQQQKAAQLVVPNQMIMPLAAHANYASVVVLEDVVEGHHHEGQYHVQVKKRFRTKFTAEQKEKMLRFAEQVGWRIQKQEESVVHRFCQEIGVKRRVLKVWMHNNKHNYNNNNNNNNKPTATTTTASDHHLLQR
ncbi:hypothetical protein Sjap_018922 [Stephania japonica]|uniref:ZF-HD dimerization-type domain-containing protein n=1 Tax=Stephania japonica TaxID=461633 RepID=A0AAP0I914_9MAGN